MVTTLMPAQVLKEALSCILAWSLLGLLQCTIDHAACEKSPWGAIPHTQGSKSQCQGMHIVFSFGM